MGKRAVNAGRTRAATLLPTCPSNAEATTPAGEYHFQLARPLPA